MRNAPKLGFGSGVGLVFASMVGSGVFLSTGFMAQDLGPGAILGAWLVGMALALCGALGYANLAQIVPRSGGEYRYLSELLHPTVGYVAGYGSLLLGFAGPVAIDAIAAGAFMKTLVPTLDVKLAALGVIGCVTALHAFDLRFSRAGQNALVGLKLFIVLFFIGVAVMFGSLAMPTWRPPHDSDGFAWAPFASSLFYITFAFSGWNAAAYAAEDFADPKRDVARATLVGCSSVGVLYLLLNWIFIANLSPQTAAAVFSYEEQRITLAHVLMTDLLGAGAGAVASVMLCVALVSAASAMMFVGPRVYAEMAKDGFLPRALRERDGKAPTASVVLQGVLAAVIVLVQSFQNIMLDISAVLTLFTLLTMLALFRVRFVRKDLPAPPVTVLLAAGGYAVLASWMLYFAFQAKTQLLLWLAIVVVVALAAYAWTHARRRSSERR